MNGDPRRVNESSLVQQYHALLDVAEAIASHKDLPSLFHDLSQKLHHIRPYDFIGVLLYDAEHNVMRLHSLETPTQLQTPPTPNPSVETSPSGYVWRTQKSLFIDVETETRFPEIIQLLRAQDMKAMYVTPLTTVNRRLGAMGFGSKDISAYSKTHLSFLQQVARQVAVAIENALNFESAEAAEQLLRRERDRTQLLLEINNALVSTLDLRDLLKVISVCLRQVIPHDAALLTLHEPKSDQLRLQALDLQMFGKVPFEEGMLISMEDTPEGQAILSRQPVLVGPVVDLMRFSSPWVRHAVDNGVRSGCAVPLISHDRTLGALSIVSTQENAFSEADAELLGQCATQIAIAVENAFNFQQACTAEQQAKHQSERLQLMLQITSAVVSQLDLRELLQVISSKICEAMGADTAGVGLYDQESGQLLAFATELPEGPGVPIPFEGTTGGLAFTSGQAVFADKPDLVRFHSDYAKRIFAAGYQSGGSIPLIAQGRKLGVLGVASKREHSLSNEDKAFLVQVANQVAIAVDNALNFERARKAEQEVRRRFERERLMLEINNAVVSKLDLRELVQVTAACLRETLHHEIAGLSLYDPDTNQLRAYAYDFPDKQFVIEEGRPVPLEGTIGGMAFTSGQAVFFNRPNAKIIPSDFNKRFAEIGVKSGGCVPLIVHGRKLGVLGVASFREDAFPDEHQELLGQIASQIAIAVDNASVYREIETLKNKLASEKLYLEEEIQTVFNFEEIIGQSAALKRILKQVETVAPTESTILIQGETGTGKELIARAIHNLSRRRERTMVKLNCAAIPTGLLESELFGHEKGAFTGAISQRLGRFELAHRGTLFLDEVGDIPLDLQPKLLRVLQEQEFERLGSARTIRVDIRLIAATNCDLAQMVTDKQYRSDLYYRLNVFPIQIPPLRQRPEDIMLLARFFTQKFARRMKKPIEAIPTEAMAALTAYPWPGNVRELEHFIERAVILTHGHELKINPAELKPPAHVASASVSVNPSSQVSTLEDAEREHIRRVLQETDWVISGETGAAARLGMKRTTLQSKMRKLGIIRPS